MSQYPKMMYKAGKGIETNIGEVANIIVKSDNEESDAIKDGWFLTPTEALTIEDNIESLATKALKGMTKYEAQKIDDKLHEEEVVTIKELQKIAYPIDPLRYNQLSIESLKDLSPEEIKEKFTVKELRSISKEVNIIGYSRMKEDELVDKLYESVNG